MVYSLGMNHIYGQTAESITARLRQDLQDARKNRDQLRMQTLQGLIARIDNAEAIQCTDADQDCGSQFFAGAKSGMGSTEAARKILTTDDIRQNVADEILEIKNAMLETVPAAQAYTDQLQGKLKILQGIVSSLE